MSRARPSSCIAEPFSQPLFATGSSLSTLSNTAFWTFVILQGLVYMRVLLVGTALESSHWLEALYLRKYLR